MGAWSARPGRVQTATNDSLDLRWTEVACRRSGSPGKFTGTRETAHVVLLGARLSPQDALRARLKARKGN